MTIIHKTVAEGDGLEFVLSDETLDRYGDVIVAAIDGGGLDDLFGLCLIVAEGEGLDANA